MLRDALGGHNQASAAFDHATLTIPASPSSAPHASSVPLAFHASALSGALPGFLARISAPS